MSSPLSALARYGQRLENQGKVPKKGYSTENISFSIVLNKDGEVVAVRDLRQSEGKGKPKSIKKQVPQAVSRAGSGALANCLWDKASYILGIVAKENDKKHYPAFRKKNLDFIGQSGDEGLIALKRFLEKYEGTSEANCPYTDPKISEFLTSHENDKDISQGNYVFELEDGKGTISDRPEVSSLVYKKTKTDRIKKSLCLLKGPEQQIARLHPQFSVKGAQSAGATMVSFNKDAFESWGKKQGDNAPINEESTDFYGKSLKFLLSREGGQSLNFGDLTLVYWAEGDEKPDLFAKALLSGGNPLPAKGNREKAENQQAQRKRDEQKSEDLKNALEKLRQGKPANWEKVILDPQTEFYLLGLNPNAARLSVSMWEVSSLKKLSENISQHIEDCGISPSPWKTWTGLMPHPKFLLAKTVALQEKFDNIPPRLGAEFMCAILNGTPYPASLLAMIIIRLRAGDNPTFGWHQALIRGILKRKKNWKDKAPMALDLELKDPPYLLGRLFAVIEKIQQEALGTPNASIRDKYFSAASSAPAGVYGQLLRNAQNHLSKRRKEGKGNYREKLLEEICSQLNDFPRSLKLEEQGQFMLGYYHQRSDFYKSNEIETNKTEGEDK